MNKCSTVILTVFIVMLGYFSPLLANGVSFYQRIAVEKNGKLVFIAENNSNLPESQRKILNCRPNRDSSCVTEILHALENELISQRSRNMKAWKNFLIGTVNFELQNFENALVSYKKVIEQTTDPVLKSATIHRIVDIYLIFRDMRSTIVNLVILSEQFPNYRTYNRVFSTYPRSLCDPAWWVCIEPTPLTKLKASVHIFESVLEKQEKLKSLSPVNLDNVDSYVRTSIQLAKLYEKICPMDIMYKGVCPDALDIYEAIYSQFPNNNGVDYAFLRIQQSKFAYEYEGDVMARSRDIIKLYTPFLEHYPDSPYAESIRNDVQKAENILRTPAN